MATKGDMFEAMRSALRLGHLVGSLTPGKQADLMMVRRDALHILSAQDPFQAVVSYVQNSDVHTVMIAGRIAKENGKFPWLARRRNELLQSAERLLSQAGAKSAH